MKRALFKAGHLPSLFACFLYFDFSFMVWVLLGPMTVLIARDLNLAAGQKGLTVATPVLAGALPRPRSTGIVAQLIVILGLLTAWLIGVPGFSQILILGAILGVAGASFASALLMVSDWYPPEHRGMAFAPVWHRDMTRNNSLNAVRI